MSKRRYVLRAMTLEDAQLAGFSRQWFDERAKTRAELEHGIREWARGVGAPYELLDDLVSWPTQDGPQRGEAGR